MYASLLETCLFENAVECSRSEVIAGLARYGDPASLGRMLELTMATPRRHKISAIVIDQAYHLAGLHLSRIPIT
jgi:hypothetical protein